jgi:hypothetical protein
MKRNAGLKIGVLLLLLTAVAAFFWFGIGDWLRLDVLKERQADLARL